MVLMNDFKLEPQELRDEMLTAVSRVIDSGWYVLGKEVEKFERNWAKICGVKHGIGVGNGMDAIEISLRALDIGPGDEVITTPMTAFATVLAILKSGATPVLADINPNTALISIESARKVISSQTKAILLVHLYGQVRDMDQWKKFCELNSINLIEDCAQAHLAEWKGNKVGSFGVVGAYSFYPTKNLGALGDAGIVVTQDDDLADKIRQIRNYGQSKRYEHPLLGLNSRLDEMHAAILSQRLKWLSKFTKRRRQIAANYNEGINNSAVQQLSTSQELSAHVYHLYVLKCERRSAFIKHLLNCEVETLIHYPIPIHHQNPCVDLRRSPDGLSASEKHANSCISIPCHPQMSNDDVNKVIEAINSF